MLIRTTLNSPFGRKVRFAALHLGLPDVEIVDTNFLDADDPLRRENPLGKMPVVTTADGDHIYDSAVIIEYFDLLATGLLPADPVERISARRFEALCDGILDAGVSIMMERRMRPAELQFAGWIAHQSGKIERGIAAVAADLPTPGVIDVRTIALACTLTWLELRQLIDWRSTAPALSDWLAAFESAAPAFAETAYPG